MQQLIKQNTDPATLEKARLIALQAAFREVDTDESGTLDQGELLLRQRRGAPTR